MNIPIPGAESEKGVVKALDDLFGPSFREFGEYLADKVRFHRLNSVRRIAQKAKKITAGSNGYIEPPPLKFLVPFVESASLEEEADEVMTDLWAKLLADASSDYDIKQIHFIRILREISGREARLLHAMATRARGGDEKVISYVDEAGMAQLYLARSSVSDFLHARLAEKMPLVEIASDFIRRYEVPGCHMHFVDVVERVSGTGWTTVEDGVSGIRTDLYKEFGSLTFELLRAASLIEEFRVDLVEHDFYGIELHAWVFTRLGAEFYENCAASVFSSEVSAN